MAPSSIDALAKELPTGLTEKPFNFNPLGCSFDPSRLKNGE
jgi:hypothetical protein